MDSLLDEAMILLGDIVHVQGRSATARGTECARLSQFCDDRRISRVTIHIDYAWPKMPHTLQSKLQEVLGYHTISMGESMKSMVLPSESSARYK